MSDDGTPIEISPGSFMEVRPLDGPGLTLIAAERARQVVVEGYTPEHDAGHGYAELAAAGAAYALHAAGYDALAASRWPFPGGFKPGPKPLDSLVKAGALIAAEIDRIVTQEAGHG